MMTSRQVCQQLGIRDYQLLYLHSQQKVPEVRRLGCVRSYTAEDLEALFEANIIGVIPEPRPDRDRPI